MRFAYLTWYNNKETRCDCGRTIQMYKSGMKQKRKRACGHKECQYSKSEVAHPRYPEYLKSGSPRRFYHWLELNLR